MWVLFVIDVIANTHARDDVKYTRYAEFKTELECVQVALDLYNEFSEGEEAICEFVKPKKPRWQFRLKT